MSVRSPLGATPASGAIDLARPRLGRERPAARGRARTLAYAGLSGLIGTVLVVALSAGQTDILLPESVRPIPSWLAGPLATAGANLGIAGVIVVFAVMFASYAVTVRHAERLSARAVLWTIAAVIALVLLAPPLLSTDVFSYMAYGRMGTLYGANPYLLGPHAIALDPFYPFVGAKWVTIPTAYGPLFTLLSYPIAAFDVAASAVAYKLVAAASAAVVVAAVWDAARLRGVNQARAAALVGLNPLLVVYGVGGGHNDLLMLAALAAGIHLVLTRRERVGGGAVMAAVGVKLTAGLVLPFALAGLPGGPAGRRRALFAGAATVGVAMAALAAVMWGAGPLHLPMTLQRSQAAGDWHSIPGFVSTRLGLGTVGHVTGLVLAAAFVAVFAWLVRLVAQGRLDWIAGAGWATLAMLATASSLLPWYVVWLLPLAALAGDRRLVRATLAVTGLVQLIQLVGYLPHGGSFLGL